MGHVAGRAVKCCLCGNEGNWKFMKRAHFKGYVCTICRHAVRGLKCRRSSFGYWILTGRMRG